MWRREARGTVADWERRATETQREIERTLAEFRAAGWGDTDTGQAIRDLIETIEVCSVNIDLLTGSGSFDDQAWIQERSRKAHARLEGVTDPVLLPGLRKLVRKWHEELVFSQVTMRAKMLDARGDRAGAGAVFHEFREWMKRPERKVFDKTGRPEDLVSQSHRSAIGFRVLAASAREH